MPTDAWMRWVLIISWSVGSEVDAASGHDTHSCNTGGRDLFKPGPIEVPIWLAKWLNHR